MRRFVVLVVVAACESSHVRLKPLPELVSARASAGAIETQLLVRRESLIWDIQWDGITIARVHDAGLPIRIAVAIVDGSGTT